ncbi:hypothetical protein VDG1235_4554 [Verrucomicrobiia bacterium DG1235]|nr:hypothetical protein VDG1235_4554 [Verrucomicrobiae bacterium DG1235]
MALEPKRPSAGLKARLEAALAEEAPAKRTTPKAGGVSRGKVIWGTTFTALVSAMAAAWAVLLVLDYRAEPPRMGGELGVSAVANDSEEALFEVGARPIEQYATLVGAEPSPVYYLEDGSPVQRVQLQFLDTEIWELDDSDERITVSSMRNEIRVIPVQSF